MMRYLVITLAAFALAGCGTHGVYTQAFKDEAQANLAKVRAATDYDLALQQFQSGDLGRALSTIDGSLRLNPNVAPGHVLYARILFEQGKTQAALGAIDRGAELDPYNPRIDYCRGIIVERMGRTEEAMTCFRRAAERVPDQPAYRMAAAEALMELGRLDEAAELLDSTESDQRLHPGFRQTLGHIGLIRGDLDQALRYFNEAVLLSPSDTVLLEDLARALIMAGRDARAVTILRRLTEAPENQERRDLKLMLAAALLELNRPVAARRILLDLTYADDGQSDTDAWTGLIDVALLLRDEHLMRKVAGQLIATAPERYEGYLAMAMWQRQTGNIDGAIQTVDRAIARAGDDPTPRCFKVVLRRQ